MFSPIIIKASYYPEGPEQDRAYVIRKLMKKIHTKWKLRALTVNQIVYSSSFILLVRRSGTTCVMRKVMFPTVETGHYICIRMCHLKKYYKSNQLYQYSTIRLHSVYLLSDI